MNKKCPKCQAVKGLNEFYKDKNKTDGKNYWCKKCQKEYQQSPKAKQYNKEYQKKYRQSPEGKQAQKKYNQSPKGKQNRKKYRQSPKFKQAQKRYYQNPEHNKKIKENSRKIRKLRKTKNLCQRCGQPNDIKGDCCSNCKGKMRQRYENIKSIVFNYYGSKCECCGENNQKFLSIDHIYRDGTKHRKEIGSGSLVLYRWLIQNNFPEGFQILCYNCNIGKAHNNGTCPHKDLL